MAAPTSGVFISYRRDDSSGNAGRLYADLREHFGEARVFMDIDTIEPGADFVEVLERTVSTWGVLLALIGKRWLTITDSRRRRAGSLPRSAPAAVRAHERPSRFDQLKVVPLCQVAARIGAAGSLGVPPSLARVHRLRSAS